MTREDRPSRIEEFDGPDFDTLVPSTAKLALTIIESTSRMVATYDRNAFIIVVLLTTLKAMRRQHPDAYEFALLKLQSDSGAPETFEASAPKAAAE
jgi:hypothetical protein